ncbi:hypothetical protein PPERSA_02503 [Pseudocohnilembus persalinus]|uniref:Transmembrane protein n=1 Tax=Pseudocohnilembus persalinus TaxID=266149 RepID=A0A0V0QB82_PSEPJ|nr:hypothetical protein PPERSA_02503 [Pseudocohnilembus persalinus]|eukprot:KRW99391.1 hypothetical protein PPERSA_02503 [Pseudocohnilembus persalinus]
MELKQCLKKNKVSPSLIFEEKKYWFDKVGVEIDKETLLQNIGHLISKEIRKQIQNSIDLNHSQPASNFSIQFLDLRGNNLGKQSLQDFKFIYKHLKNIFIINDWNGIDNELAITIVNTYIDLYQNYQIQQNLVPYYLKVITINNSEVDDEFCKYFAKKLILLKNLTEIDFSKNNQISSIGLKYLYIYMFDLAAQDLMITKFKIHNNIINKQDENLMSRILQSLAQKFKKIECIRIKTNAFYSQISRPYKFKLNFYLMDKDGFKEFIHFCKLWMCYSNIVILIQITLHIIIYISDYQKDNDKELQLQQFIKITLIMVLTCLLGEIIIYFRVRSLERAQFYFLQKERKKDDKRLVNIHSKWYTYIFPTILQFIDRIEIYFDILLIYAFIGLDKKNYSYKVFSILSAVFIIIKILERVAFFLTWWLKQKNSNWGQDTGEILYESWHLISTQNFYLIQPYIIRTAPTYSYSFFGKYKFEGHTFILSVRLLFETLPILILYITYLILSAQKENEDQIYQFVYIGLFITIILIIVSDTLLQALIYILK